tara:strand:- start:485 stop:664 length:180 start_codon:yes stop_codon:yes gene_type:complete
MTMMQSKAGIVVGMVDLKVRLRFEKRERKTYNDLLRFHEIDCDYDEYYALKDMKTIRII